MELEALSEAQVGPIETWNTFLSLGRYPETGNILDVLLLSFPLQKLWALPTHYNIKIFLILCLNGLCGYALARSFVADRLACLAACGGRREPCCGSDLAGRGCVSAFFGASCFSASFRVERKGTWQSGALAGLSDWPLLSLVQACSWRCPLLLGVEACRRAGTTPQKPFACLPMVELRNPLDSLLSALLNATGG